mmetsp:Transcript_66083/g.138026  ORF Transcript_66083/g.138026 Transcript_66083/m.138026 type:complete len:212 (+) Transcript_66083:342-977(+)
MYDRGYGGGGGFRRFGDRPFQRNRPARPEVVKPSFEYQYVVHDRTYTEEEKKKRAEERAKKAMARSSASTSNLFVSVAEVEAQDRRNQEAKLAERARARQEAEEREAGPKYCPPERAKDIPPGWEAVFHPNWKAWFYFFRQGGLSVWTVEEMMDIDGLKKYEEEQSPNDLLPSRHYEASLDSRDYSDQAKSARRERRQQRNTQRFHRRTDC